MAMVDELIKKLIFSLKIKEPEKLIKTLETVYEKIDELWDKAKVEVRLQYKDTQSH